MASDEPANVRSAIREINILSPTTFSWFGVPVPALSSTVRRMLSTEAAREYLLFTLQSRLYSHFYCLGYAAPAVEEPATSPPTGRTDFVDQLSLANRGSGYWDHGWEVQDRDNEHLVVSKTGLALWISPDRCRSQAGTVVDVGAVVSIRFPKEFLGISPGFYMAVGEVDLDEGVPGGLLRLYWNISPVGASSLVSEITGLCNRSRVPFRLKLLNDPFHYNRCDSGVLYIQKSDYEEVAALLADRYLEIAAGLRWGVPAFTKRLASGLAVAEDPGTSESFGLHRCRLFADGLIRAHEDGKTSISGRFQAVEERFAEEGIDLSLPYKNSASEGVYRFSPNYVASAYTSFDVSREPIPEYEPIEYLATATAIGQRLVREAMWHGNRCNWLGVEPLDSGSHKSEPTLTYATLGPDLYSGTSGVALFLAELFAVTGDRSIRHAALGAVEQALACVDEVPESQRFGCYTGWLGIAYASLRVGSEFGIPELMQRAEQLVTSGYLFHVRSIESDLLSGRAGAVVALLAIRHYSTDSSLLELVSQTAEDLLLAADKSDHGYSWASHSSSSRRNLTGFSHGAYGVGFALLEAYRATGDSRFQRAATEAFRYEDRWFDAKVGNWPDFRKATGKGGRTRSFVSFWCHGAPGIALSRLRAYEILGDETYRTEALTGLATTQEVVESWILTGHGNYSLCHGMSGNAEILLYGSQVLGGGWTEGTSTAGRVANLGISRHGAHDLSWPCGTSGGETPSLMLGLAGIGYFYLRLHNPSIPSMLLIL